MLFDWHGTLVDTHQAMYQTTDVIAAKSASITSVFLKAHCGSYPGLIKFSRAMRVTRINPM